MVRQKRGKKTNTVTDQVTSSSNISVKISKKYELMFFLHHEENKKKIMNSINNKKSNSQSRK